MNRISRDRSWQFACGLALLFIAILATACERHVDDPLPEVPPAATPPDDPTAALYPPEVAQGFALRIEKRGSRAYSAHGWTDRADSVRIEVEDGHNILFGPVVLAVREEHFATDFRIEPTDRDHVFVYVTDAQGNRLAVVPVDTARAITAVGPRERVIGTGVRGQ